MISGYSGVGQENLLLMMSTSTNMIGIEVYVIDDLGNFPEKIWSQNTVTGNAPQLGEIPTIQFVEDESLSFGINNYLIDPDAAFGDLTHI